MDPWYRLKICLTEAQIRSRHFAPSKVVLHWRRVDGETELTVDAEGSGDEALDRCLAIRFHQLTVTHPEVITRYGKLGEKPLFVGTYGSPTEPADLLAPKKRARRIESLPDDEAVPERGRVRKRGLFGRRRTRKAR